MNVKVHCRETGQTGQVPASLFELSEEDVALINWVCMACWYGIKTSGSSNRVIAGKGPHWDYNTIQRDCGQFD